MEEQQPASPKFANTAAACEHHRLNEITAVLEERDRLVMTCAACITPRTIVCLLWSVTVSGACTIQPSGVTLPLNLCCFATLCACRCHHCFWHKTQGRRCLYDIPHVFLSCHGRSVHHRGGSCLRTSLSCCCTKISYTSGSFWLSCTCRSNWVFSSICFQ